MRFIPPPRNVTGARVLGISRENHDKLFARRFNEKFFIGKAKEGDYGFFDFVKARAQHLAFCRIASATDAWEPKAVNLEVERFNATMVVPDAYLKLHRDGRVHVVDTDFPFEIMLKPAPFKIGDDSGVKAKRLQDGFGLMLAKINPFLEYPCAAICNEGNSLAIRRVHSDFDHSCYRTYGEPLAWVKERGLQAVDLLNELISGTSGLIALRDGSSRYIRLIINFCEKGCDAAENIIKGLQEQYKGVIERYTISKPP